MIDASPLVRSRAFLLEFDGWDSWSGVEEQIARTKSYGFRTFAKSNDDPVTVKKNDIWICRWGEDYYTMWMFV
jgi:hypothetical protein